MFAKAPTLLRTCKQAQLYAKYTHDSGCAPSPAFIIDRIDFFSRNYPIRSNGTSEPDYSSQILYSSIEGLSILRRAFHFHFLVEVRKFHSCSSCHCDHLSARFPVLSLQLGHSVGFPRSVYDELTEESLEFISTCCGLAISKVALVTLDAFLSIVMPRACGCLAETRR